MKTQLKGYMDFLDDNTLIYENTFGRFFIEIAKIPSPTIGETHLDTNQLEQISEYGQSSVRLVTYQLLEKAIVVNGVSSGMGTALTLRDFCKLYNAENLKLEVKFFAMILKGIINEYKYYHPEEYL